jgi:hypothetical protein
MKAVRASGVLRSAISAAVWCAMAAMMGCGGNRATVSGKVTYHNAPVTGGMLTLYPASGNPFMVPLNADGTFEMQDAPVGQMQVTIATDNVTEVRVPPGGTDPAGKVDPSKMPKKVNIPVKYNDPKTSNLTWDVKPGKNADKTFDLTD